MLRSRGAVKYGALLLFAVVFGLVAFLAPPAKTSPSTHMAGVLTITSGNKCFSNVAGGSAMAPKDFFNVVQGGTYNLEFSGTGCTGDSVTIWVQGGFTGNFRIVLTDDDTNGTYTGSVTMPNPACFTYPLSYACGDIPLASLKPSNTEEVTGPNGGHAHLRASTFDADCKWLGQDENCTADPPQGCQITKHCPLDVELQCGDSTDPSVTGEATYEATGDLGGVACTATVTHEDVVGGGCTGNDITRTWTITGSDDSVQTCVQKITFVDTTAPELSGLPTDKEITLECGDEVPAAPEVTFTDNCSGSGTVPVDEKTEDGGCVDKVKQVITRTWSITDACGNPASFTQTITIKDTTAPTVVCPKDITVNSDANTCSATVTYDAMGSDDCSEVTVSFDPPSGSVFPVGTTTVTATATDACGNVSEPCTFTVTVLGSVCVTKFYDTNTNGVQDNGEVGIAGWQIKLDDGQIGITGDDGTVCFNVAVGTVKVTESSPAEASWKPTAATTATVTITAGDCHKSVSFGNVCIGGGGGGLTLGFWSNPNGKALFGADDLALMVAVNLRNSDGSNFDPTSYDKFRTWILGASATNMANMLSAQMAAMKLNVYNGKVLAGAIIYAPGTVSGGVSGFATVGAILTEANTELGLHGLTKDGSPYRAYQEALKNALDKANNNLNFVQSSPCSFSFP